MSGITRPMRSRSSVKTDTKLNEQYKVDAPHLDKPNPATGTRVPVDEPQSKMAAAAKLDKLEDKVDEEDRRRDQRERQQRAAAPKSASDLNMGKHQRIVDQLFDMPEPMDVFTKILGSLSFGGRASTLGYGELVDALDEAQSTAQEAAQLVANVKVAHDAFEIDAKVIEAGLLEGARLDLQAQKAAGTFTKQITIGDVDEVAAKKYPDEYRDLAMRRARAKRATSAVEALADRAAARAGDLRSMVAKARSEG